MPNLTFAQTHYSLSAPLVAVVILNYNGKNHLNNFLPSILQSTYSNIHVVVADNASTDDSVSFVRQYFPQVQVLVNSKNDGFAGGYNWALKQIQAQYYVILNSDVEVTPSWIEPIIELMEHDKQIGACQPKILSYHKKTHFEYAGASGGYIDFLGYPFSRGRIFDVVEEDKQQYNQPQPVFWASGAALFIRASLFHQLNGFNEHFFAHQEEIDLCWRIQLAGHSLFVQPQSVVYHVGGGTLPRGGRKVFLNFRNNLMMLFNNLPWHQVLFILPIRFLLDAISAWKGLLQGDKSFFFAIVKAHWAVITFIITGKTQRIQHTKSIFSLQGVLKKSIVWKHFVLKNNYYSEVVK